MKPSLEALLDRLVARGHLGMVLGLGRTRDALSRVGSPEVGLRAFHVAGSNGKGSVCAMIDAALGEAGLRRGLYTSPHLERFSERIAIDGAPIADDLFAAALARVFDDAGDGLTFFETLTVAAFVALREAGIDLAVLEVGLGGRADSTNVVAAPVAAGVVSITQGLDGAHLEHGALLGGTAEEIAAEKAAIFKAGCPAIIGPMADGPREVCARTARAVGADPVELVDRATAIAGVARAPRLRGAHQLDNAAVAAAMLVAARPRVPGLERAHIERGIASARWPGRLEELVLAGVTVLLDGAHNVDGARALVDELRARALDPRRTTLVFGALADKGYRPFLEMIAPFAHARFYAEPGGRAAASPDELSRIASGIVCSSPEDAIERARGATPPGGVVLVTGSLYLVGAVRARLLGAHRDPALGL
ncbi:MAG: cyanophycin synthetase [Polyangiaceae bacterium]